MIVAGRVWVVAWVAVAVAPEWSRPDPTSLEVAQPCPARDPVLFPVPEAAPPPLPYAPLGWGRTPFSEVELGVGHVHLLRSAPTPDLPPGAYDWRDQLELPLADRPGGGPTRWIVEGWVVEEGGVAGPLGTTGLVETGYEEATFVLVRREGDWLEIRFGEGPAETGWLPRCALDSGPVPLEASSWEAWLLADERGPLRVRASSARVLRASPSSRAAALAEAPDGYVLEPLEVRGVWMRVVLSRPSAYCDPDATPVRTEGWIEWYDETIGPRVWYPTRGC